MEKIRRFKAFWEDLEQTIYTVEEDEKGEYILLEELIPVIRAIVTGQYYDNEFLEAVRVLEALLPPQEEIKS